MQTVSESIQHHQGNGHSVRVNTSSLLTPKERECETVPSIFTTSTCDAVLTHAGDDAVHRQPGGGVVEPADRQALVVLLLLLEDEGRVLLLGDVDVVAGVGGGHDVAGPGVQEDALVVLPLHSDQTHAVPTGEGHISPAPKNTVEVKRVTNFLWA